VEKEVNKWAQPAQLESKWIWNFLNKISHSNLRALSQPARSISTLQLCTNACNHLWKPHQEKSTYRFPGFCGREIHIAGRIALHQLQNTVTIKRKKKCHLLFPWKKYLGYSSHPSLHGALHRTRSSFQMPFLYWGHQTIPSIQMRIPSAKQREWCLPQVCCMRFSQHSPGQGWPSPLPLDQLSIPWDPKSPPALPSFHRLLTPFFHLIPSIWIPCLKFTIFHLYHLSSGLSRSSQHVFM